MPFLSLYSFPLLALPHPIRFAALAQFLRQQNDQDEQRGNRPPQAKTQLPYGLGDSGAFAEPLEQTPNVGSAGDSKDPGNCARRPERTPLRLALTHFLQAKLHAELRPARESGGEGNRRGVQRTQRLLCFLRVCGAVRALLQMCAEPIAFGLRNSFDALLRNELFSACMMLIAHAAPPCSTPRSASNPRYSRDFTVENGTLSTPAISSICNSSWKRRTSTSR